jgi:large subunit ribosomal protein L24
MSTKLKIKKKDRVIVITGKDKGRIGEVTAVMPKENRVIVSGINMIVDPKENKPTRVGYKMIKDRKVRVARRSGEVID